MVTCRIVLITMGSLLASGCNGPSRASVPAPTGFLIGHDSGGVALIRLEDGTKDYIRGREDGHLWWGAVWCPSLSRIACVDTYKAVSLIAIGKGPPEIVYPIQKGRRVDSLAVTPKGTLVFVDGHSSGNSRLVTLDLSTRKHRVVGEANFGVDFIQVIGEERAIVRKRTRPNDAAPWSEHVVSVDLATGKESELASLTANDWFAASPSGKWLLVATPESFRLYDTKSTVPRDVRPIGLPGRNGGERGCFISDDEVVLFREYDTKLPIGIFRLNVRTGESSRVTGESLSNPSYLQKAPAASR